MLPSAAEHQPTALRGSLIAASSILEVGDHESLNESQSSGYGLPDHCLGATQKASCTLDDHKHQFGSCEFVHPWAHQLKQRRCNHNAEAPL